MSLAEELLLAYDRQLRTEAEVASALRVERLGPLHLAVFDGGIGFVTYARPEGEGAGELPSLVAEALLRFRQDPAVVEVEWKTSGHDRVPGLHEALLHSGFVPGEPESIMVGRAELLASDVPLPEGVGLRRIGEEGDVLAMAKMQDEVFSGDAVRRVPEMLRLLQEGDDMELWVAEAEGRVIAAGRLRPVVGSEFAGVWGGATLPAWRGRGVYRALTAARARSALRLGKTLIYSDSSEYSRPILERSGLLRVSTTTPYVWRS